MSEITNNAGDGNIDGIGIGTRGEPPINKKKKILKRFKEFLINGRKITTDDL